MGTLNGTDSTDQTVSVGERDELECDLIPLGLAGELGGEWRAYVDDESVAIVSIDNAGGRAVLAPPDPPGYYANAGQVQVRCVFVTPDGDVITEFNRTVTVTGELSGLPCICEDEQSLILVSVSMSVSVLLFVLLLVLVFRCWCRCGEGAGADEFSLTMCGCGRVPNALVNRTRV